MDTSRMVGASQNQKYPDGTVVGLPSRVGNQGDLIVSQLHGAAYEACERGCLFQGANQAATTTTVALATTYTGLCVSNPAGNYKKFIMRYAGYAFAAAPTNPAAVAVGGGWTAGGIVTHTTPLSVYNMKLGGTEASTALVDSAATLVGTPRVIHSLMSSFTAATLMATTPTLVDLGGSIIVMPGGYVFIYTLTVSSIIGSLVWEEVPI